MSNVPSRALHDLGLAAWFGGSLMGAVAVNGAAAQASDPTERARLASVGWERWTPVNLTAIGAHLVGGAGLTLGNTGRMAGQAGVARAAAFKTVLTGAALTATAYSRALGRAVVEQSRTEPVPAEGATEPAGTTPAEVAAAQRKLRALQWSIPALTGAMLVVNSVMGEQQRPVEVGRGFLARLPRRRRR
jgi:hypothetical protein